MRPGLLLAAAESPKDRPPRTFQTSAHHNAMMTVADCNCVCVCLCLCVSVIVCVHEFVSECVSVCPQRIRLINVDDNSPSQLLQTTVY